MDTLSFIAKLIEVLAWPGAIVTVVLLLRKELKQLVPLLRKVKAGPVEAEFEREIAQLERAARHPHCLLRRRQQLGSWSYFDW
jgi:hypothetical protein